MDSWKRNKDTNKYKLVRFSKFNSPMTQHIRKETDQLLGKLGCTSIIQNKTNK